MMIETASGKTLELPPENRVRFATYGKVDRGDTRLVNIPSSGAQQKLHWAAAIKFTEMAAAAKKDGHTLKVASGWRRKLWPTRDAYNAAMIEQYGSVAEGKMWRAYESPHMTGLTVDFGSGGLAPTRRTRAAQHETDLFDWLVDNAATYGFTPYCEPLPKDGLCREPWHWEIALPLAVHKAKKGEVDLADFDIGTSSFPVVRTSLIAGVLAALGGLLIWKFKR